MPQNVSFFYLSWDGNNNDDNAIVWDWLIDWLIDWLYEIDWEYFW